MFCTFVDSHWESVGFRCCWKSVKGIHDGTRVDAVTKYMGDGCLLYKCS